MNTVFDDMPSDDFGAVSAIKPMSVIAQPRFVTAQPAPAVYRSACGKCGGSGIYYGPSPYGRHCFPCGGTGYMSYKTSPEQRANARAKSAERKERQAQERVNNFASEQPEAYAWMVAKAPAFDFANSMLEALKKWGSLTDSQLGAVQRCIERDKARDAERAVKAAAPKPAAQVLYALHDVMQRHSKFYAGEMTLSRRREDQLVWIKHANAEKVIGKIDGGVLSLWNRPGVDMDGVKAMLEEFEGAPLQAAMKYGKLSGRCCSCGRELTDESSIANGIGPICAAKFG